jgi:hypothetical protein
MLDLKELERRLDEALAKETSETLNDWLSEIRKDNFESILGQGCIEEIESLPIPNYVQAKSKGQKFSCSQNYNPSTDLAQAA